MEDTYWFSSPDVTNTHNDEPNAEEGYEYSNGEIRMLVEGLAAQLAFFQGRKMYGKYHIGRDMELCGYGGWFNGKRPQQECSPRCEEIRILLYMAAEFLGKDIEWLRRQAKKRVQAAKSG